MSAFTRSTLVPVRFLTACALAAALVACAAPAEDDQGATDSSASSTPSESTPASESASATPSESPSEKPSTKPPAGPSLKVTVKGGDVTPNAEEIKLAVGKPLMITFTSDRAGELHVHSKPEQYVEFAAGKSTRKLVITTPGTVEVEEHETGAVVAVLEVR